MSSGPYFSVIVPMFNSAPYIEDTLESLRAQSWRDFEILVVDDGSTDRSRDIATGALRRAGVPARVIDRRDHGGAPKGVASCRNIGAQQAVGTWLVFLDSDDLAFPSRLERLHAAAEEFNGPLVGIYHAVERFDDETGTTLTQGANGAPGVPRDILLRLLDENLIITSGAAITHQAFIDAGGFDTRLHGVEDYWMWIRIASRGSWLYLSEPLTRYRVRSNSLMGGRPFVHYADQMGLLLRVAQRSSVLTHDQQRRLAHGAERMLRYRAAESAITYGRLTYWRGLLRLVQLRHVSLVAKLLWSGAVSGVLRSASHVSHRLKASRGTVT